MFGTVNLTKNADSDKYSSSGYRLGFLSPALVSYSGFDWGRKVVIFGVDNSSPVDLDSKKKSILVLSEGATHRLHDTMRITKAK